MIYVPELNNYSCYVVNSDSTIRAYKTIPQRNSDVNYRDYYYTSNYLYKDGTQAFSQYSQLPICLAKSDLTSNIFYRNDLSSILVSFIILAFLVVYLPYKIFSRAFGRWFKL